MRELHQALQAGLELEVAVAVALVLAERQAEVVEHLGVLHQEGRMARGGLREVERVEQPLGRG
jgi:hypothetical protein